MRGAGEEGWVSGGHDLTCNIPIQRSITTSPRNAYERRSNTIWGTSTMEGLE